MSCLYVQYKSGLPMSVKLLQTDYQAKKNVGKAFTHAKKQSSSQGEHLPLSPQVIEFYIIFFPFIFIEVNGER